MRESLAAPHTQAAFPMADFSPLSTLRRMSTGLMYAQPGTTLGRFELKKLLGQGAQSQVWLAFDSRLEREVAIKLLKMGRGADAQVIAQWLQEARSVSRLTHPNVVPVFEADVQDQQPYLVFEFAQGKTLEALTKKSSLPVQRAVRIVLDVLSALIAAHALGVVHRDLKPSNVIVDDSGRARVMDFGIAARVNKEAGSAQGKDAAGTPNFMSPEAARGEPVTPLMDVYGAGLLLAQSLSDRPLVPNDDPYRVIYKVAHEPLRLPPPLLASLDDTLRSILLQSIAFEPGRRYPSAQIMHDALEQWLNSQLAPGAAEVANVGAASGTLEFLLRKMRHKTDFPALSDSIIRIQNMAASDKESISSVTNEILKNVALTNKLLRLVNSAHYSRGYKVGTVSRAVTLVGFNGIRNMALSLVLLDHMQDRHNAQFLKEEFIRALMAASIASEMGQASGHGEEAFIGAMFHNLGRMLTQFYFPEEAAAIRELMNDKKNPMSESAASERVLGLDYEELGSGVAQAWGLPEVIQRCILKPEGDPPSQPMPDLSEQLRWMAAASNEMMQDMLDTDPETVRENLDHTFKRYTRVLGLPSNALRSMTKQARGKLVDLARAMDIVVPQSSPVAHLLQDFTVEPAKADAKVAGGNAFQANELHATHVNIDPAAAAAFRQSEERTDLLAAGIQDITNVMVEEFKLVDVLRMILEAMYRALEFRRILFCMRDARLDTLTGRFGLGAGVEGVVKHFAVPLRQGAKLDLFSAVCLKGADTLINDASDPRIASSLPAWYRQHFNAPTFMVLPLLTKGKPFGLIYADKAKQGSLTVDEKELALLRTLRNQAIMAFKQLS
ncbi:serine/threonine protein kinase [Candidatus Symbiobacter mobilis]|nr:serine/threonine protein kinase [Candidatus Symbiobacter mobilis]